MPFFKTSNFTLYRTKFHVDFYELNEGKKSPWTFLLKLGAALGFNSGGTLILNKRKLRVRALPKNLPDFITADISALELGNKLYTAQLQTDGYSFLHPDNTVVCQVKTSRASIKNAAAEEEETTEESAE